MDKLDRKWLARLEALGNPNFAGPVLVAIAIIEGAQIVAKAIENAGQARSGASSTGSSMPSEEHNDGST